jgi:hypothetical protein
MNLDQCEGGSSAAQQQSELKREFKGVWIPASLWKRKDVTWFQKCLLAEIDSLDKGCFASNAYLAKHMGVPPRTLTNNLTELRKKGLILDWGFNGRFRQISVADNISSDPKHTRHRVGRVPANGYADIPESGTIDTSTVPSLVPKETKEDRKRFSCVSEEEKDRLLRGLKIPHNAPSDIELAEILSRFPSISKYRRDMLWHLKGTKFHHWKRNHWVPIINVVKYLEPLENRLSKICRV